MNIHVPAIGTQHAAEHAWTTTRRRWSRSRTSTASARSARRLHYEARRHYEEYQKGHEGAAPASGKNAEKQPPGGTDARGVTAV